MDKKYTKGVCWLRRDLRLSDHAALATCLNECEKVAVVFVFDKSILKKYSGSARRISFMFDSIEVLKNSLKNKGSALVTLSGTPAEELPNFIEKWKADVLYANEDYEMSAKKRDKNLSKILEKTGIDFYLTKDQVIFAPEEIKNASGKPYQVYSSYKKKWLQMVDENPESIFKYEMNYENLDSYDNLKDYIQNVNFEDLGIERADYFIEAGEKAACKQFSNFLKKIKNYHIHRDRPDQNGTSLLAAHLRFGTIAIRELVRRVIFSKDRGSQVWLSELIWRDFYFAVLDQFPWVEKKSFKESFDSLKWENNSKWFDAWKKGKTGIPIVDAGMRELNETGYMHNRLRMIVANFLTKILFIHWYKGERYFAEKLIDYDLSANNGNWQWSAGSGCDAAPYFRIFNPFLQSKKFDPEGRYIKKFCPELKHLSANEIHRPTDLSKDRLTQAGITLGSDYPHEIVNYESRREKVLKKFKKA